MATSKSKSTTTDPDIQVIKEGACPTLSATGSIGYQITLDSNSGIQIALTSNSGNGYFCRDAVSLDSILERLDSWAEKYPVTSLALKDVFPAYTSCNSWGFLMAVLLNEGLITRDEDNRRHFLLCDPASFLQQVKEKKGKHTSSSKGKTKVTA